MTLTFDTYFNSLTPYVECVNQYRHIRQNRFQRVNNFHFFSYQSLSEQILPLRKIDQGQPRAII